MFLKGTVCRSSQLESMQQQSVEEILVFLQASTEVRAAVIVAVLNGGR